MRWRVPSTTPTLHSQRAKPSPSWSRLCPGIRSGSGLARIPRVLCGKARAAPALRVPAPHGASWRHTGGGGSGGSAPPFLTAGAAPGRGKWSTLRSTTYPSPSGGRSLHSDPWREGHRALPRLGPINRSVLPLDTRRPGSRPSHPSAGGAARTGPSADRPPRSGCRPCAPGQPPPPREDDRSLRPPSPGSSTGSRAGVMGGQGRSLPGRGFEGAGAPRQPQCITLGRLAPRHYAVRRRPRCPRLARLPPAR